jgi:hypothetical protein
VSMPSSINSPSVSIDRHWPGFSESSTMTGVLIVWEKGGRMWRKREDHDEKGKRAQD